MTTARPAISIEQLPPPLLQTLPDRFSSYHPYVAADTLRQFTAARLSVALEHPDANVITIEENGAIQGLACWRKLRWDTQMFGFPAARLELLLSGREYHDARAVASDLVDKVLNSCRAHGIRHLIARIDFDELANLHALEGAGFELIDGIATFSLPLAERKHTSLPAGFSTRLFRPDDLEQILFIARHSYTVDRFHTDPALTRDTADNVNETWVRNLCLGDADAVVLALRAGVIAAYVTCTIQHDASPILGTTFGTIAMVATRSDLRGNGAASVATAAALDWFQEHDTQVVEVGTQFRNTQASRLYERSGFRHTASHLTLRKLL